MINGASPLKLMKVILLVTKTSSIDYEVAHASCAASLFSLHIRQIKSLNIFNYAGNTLPATYTSRHHSIFFMKAFHIV